MHRLLIALSLLSLTATVAVAQPHRDDRRDDRPSPRRELWQLQQELDDKLDALEAIHDRQLDILSARSIRGHQQRELKDLVRRASDITRDLKAVRVDMREAIRDLGYVRPQPRPDIRPEPRPEPVRGPFPLTPDRFAFVYKSIEDATFPDHQLNAIRDAINTDAYFDIAQARRILELFSHETHKVEAGVLLCPRIVEPGALPHLLATFTFESYKQQLRNRTGNVCGF